MGSESDRETVKLLRRTEARGLEHDMAGCLTGALVFGLAAWIASYGYPTVAVGLGVLAAIGAGGFGVKLHDWVKIPKD